jgi:heat shock protein HslJ
MRDGQTYREGLLSNRSSAESSTTSVRRGTPGRAVLVAKLIVCALLLSAGSVFAVEDLADPSGTAWELVEIASMDDSLYRPKADGDYGLTFGIDGSISAAAGCNRATGSIDRWDPPRIQFSELASTRAYCGRESISERYLGQLGWVRSYLYENGRLYLATMADGSIMEFAPLPAEKASATVGSLSLQVHDANALRDIILSRLLTVYAAQAGIEITAAEKDRYLTVMEQRLHADPGNDFDDSSSLTADEQAEVEHMRGRMAESVILQWKVNKVLHEQYGGRVVYQQLGPEPLDAYLAFLKDAQQAGQFTIRDGNLAADFWAFFSDERRNAFMPTGSEDEAVAFATPPWERVERKE